MKEVDPKIEEEMRHHGLRYEAQPQVQGNTRNKNGGRNTRPSPKQAARENKNMSASQTQTEKNHSNTNNVRVEEEALDTLKEINRRLEKIEANTSAKRKVVEGTAIAVGAGATVFAGIALARWVFGGPKPVVAPVPVVSV
jgi:hypothetical protein